MTWLTPQLWLRPHVQSTAAILIGRCRQNLFTTLCRTTRGFVTLAAGAAVLTTSGAGGVVVAASAAGAGTSAAAAGRLHAPATAKAMKAAPIRCLIIMRIDPLLASFAEHPNPEGSWAT